MSFVKVPCPRCGGSYAWAREFDGEIQRVDRLECTLRQMTREARLPSQATCEHKKWIGPYSDDGPGIWMECEGCGKLKEVKAHAEKGGTK